ncbi:AAA family ATPase [Pelagibaculum spongiae]|uniref:Flagellar biosynthesis protein FlhF n=1 Tax=Pelagibaculum spongiae TaxID=2080658 RepID=A0A2V1GXU2_9GAMM|nr:AAA family ATPase [Pelagibaculum spongiae]PVZ66695.1 hypothetical protein DC094_15615 [Pelagibaculum spongiae]
MRMQRFTAPDMRRAMRQIKEELGAEAVILSSKKHAAGVELVAAIDCDESLAAIPDSHQQAAFNSQPAIAERRPAKPASWKAAMNEKLDEKPSLAKRALAGFSRNSQRPAMQAAQSPAPRVKQAPQASQHRTPTTSHLNTRSADTTRPTQQKNAAQSMESMDWQGFSEKAFAKATQAKTRQASADADRSAPTPAVTQSGGGNAAATFGASSFAAQVQRQVQQQAQSQRPSDFDLEDSHRHQPDQLKISDQAFQADYQSKGRQAQDRQPENTQPQQQNNQSQQNHSFSAPAETTEMSKIEAQIEDLKKLMEQMAQNTQAHHQASGLYSVNPLAGQNTSAAASTISPMLPQSEIANKLQQKFANFGLSHSLCQEMGIKFADLGTDAGFERGVRSLTDQITCIDDDILAQEGVIALVGPTGAGKTTTIAKLAARYVMRFGPKSLVLINNDSYRIGAREQLRTYGRILGVDVVEAENTQQMHHILDSMQGKKMALIDTTGISEQNSGIPDWLVPGHARIPVNRYLVLPAIGQLGYQQHAIERFSALGLNGCILSKVDEALGLGESLGALIDSQLPLLAVTNGQRVPEDLARPPAGELVEQALKLHRRSAANNEFKDKLVNAFR